MSRGRPPKEDEEKTATRHVAFRISGPDLEDFEREQGPSEAAGAAAKRLTLESLRRRNRMSLANVAAPSIETTDLQFNMPPEMIEDAENKEIMPRKMLEATGRWLAFSFKKKTIDIESLRRILDLVSEQMVSEFEDIDGNPIEDEEYAALRVKKGFEMLATIVENFSDTESLSMFIRGYASL